MSRLHLVYGIRWGAKYFESKFIESAWFVPVFLILCMTIFYFSLFMFYYPNVYGREDISLIVCSWDCEGLVQSLDEQGKRATSYIIEFWPEFRQSAFITFMFAGLFGWFSNWSLKKLIENKYL